MRPGTRRAGIRFVQTSCTGLDLDTRQVRCATGEDIAFDYASIDAGPVANLDQLAGTAEHGVPVRPIEGCVAAWPGLLERLRHRSAGFKLVIVGDGAAAVELAFAIQARLTTEGLGATRLTLVGGTREPLPGFLSLLRRKTARLLAERGIAHFGNQRASAVPPGLVQLADGSSLGADADARPKSGVFAVRAVCQGQAPQPWLPQKRALYLLSTGQRHALAAWGGFSASGAWAWRLEDRIDRRFIAQFGA